MIVYLKEKVDGAGTPRKYTDEWKNILTPFSLAITVLHRERFAQNSHYSKLAWKQTKK